MVRRWSYLISSVDQTSLLNVRKAHAFKIFRKSTKFKRFNRGLVDFVRRKNIRRKKSINYITLSYLSSNWAKHYLNSKSVARFSQSVLMNKFSFESLNPELVQRLAIKTSFTKGLHLTSLPTQRAISMLRHFSSTSVNLLSRNYTRGALLSVIDHDFKRASINRIGASSNLQISSKYFVSARNFNLLQSLNYALAFQPAISVASSVRSIIILCVILSSF